MFASTISKAALIASMAFAMATAVPLQSRSAEQQSECTSYGSGPLGFNASAIRIYADDAPKTYFGVQAYGDSERLVASGSEQTQFEFFNCTYSPDPVQMKGSVDAWQGYIKAPSGQCLTVDPLYEKGARIITKDCDYRPDLSFKIAPEQHFQVQHNSFFNFKAIVALANDDGSSSAQKFGKGENFHFSLVNDDHADVLNVDWIEGQPQDAGTNRKNMLIGQF